MVGWGKLRFSILSLIILVGVLGFMSAAITNTNTGSTYSTIQEAINEASAGNTINIAEGNYDITSQINVNIPISIVGDGVVTIKANNPSWGSSNKHLLDIGGNLVTPVTISNIVFDSNNEAYGVQSYKSSAIFNNVEMKNSKGAGLTVNGATIVATNLITEGNSWGAVNVDPGLGVTTASVFTLNSGTLSEENQIWSDGAHVSGSATVSVDAAGYNKYAINGQPTNFFTWTNRALTNTATITKNSVTTKYNSIQSAINAASDGDTIEVYSGTYNERLSITKNNLIIEEAEGSNAIIHSPDETFTSVRRLIDIRGNGVTFRGFEVVGNGKNNLTNYDGSYLGIRIDGYGITVENNIVRDLLTGIQTTSINPVTANNILGNTILNVAVGISLQNDGNNVVNNNINAINEGFGLASFNTHFENNLITVGEKGYEAKISFGHANNTLKDGTYTGSIQDGINAVSDGDTVYVSAGEYVENITINKPITLLGAQANIPYIDGGRGAESKIICPDKPTYAILISSSIATIADGVDGVTINGFEITAPKGMQAIHSGNNGPSDLNIQFNYIHDVGTEYAASSGVHGINYRMGANNETNVNISDNYIVNVAKFPSVINGGGSAGIWVGQSTANGTLSNLTIERNFIKEIKTNVSHKEFELSYGDVAKYTASGIYIGVAWNSNVYTGKVNAPIIQNNIITEVEGGTAYGIELTGNTPSAEIKKNIISNINSPQSPSYAFGIGVTSTNKGISTITITRNKITNVLTAVANGNINFLDAKDNYWGTNDGSVIASLISGKVSYAPWFVNEEMTLSTIGQVIEKDTTTNITTSTIENEINLTIEDITVTLPADLVISSTDTTWNGTILPPTIRENATVEPNTDGLTETVSKVIEVGFEGVKLILSNAVKIVIPGETGKKVGYSYNGTFYKITNNCSENTQAWADANLAEGADCYYDDGVDMIIWTKHFTQFVTYNASDTEAPILVNTWSLPLFSSPLEVINIFANFTDPSGISYSLIRMRYHFVEGPLNNTDSTFEDANMTFDNAEESFSLWNYSAPMTPIDGQDGYFKIKFSAVDGSGNVRNFPGTTSYDLFISVDGTPANTNLSLNGSNSGNYITSNTQIKLNATDVDWDGAGNYQPSGINYSKYKINNGDWNLFGSYTNFLIDSSHSDGNYTIDYYSVDNATNVEQPEKSTILTLDNTKPIISIISPENKTYNSTINQLNYSASDSGSGLNSCWYNNGTLNSTLNNCLSNFTEFSSNEGLNTWTLYANDSVGNLNSAEIYFTQDTITPTIDYNANTPENNSYLNVNSVLVNVSIVEVNVGSVILNWNGINESITNNLNGNYWITKSNLSDGIYSFNVFVNDSVEHSNATETRMVTIDRTKPLINFLNSTTPSGNYSQSYINANISASDFGSGLNNTRIYLYDSNVLVNSSTELEINFTGLDDGTYYLNATAEDNAGNINSTETRTILLDTTNPFVEIMSPSNNSNLTGDRTIYVNATDLNGISNVEFKLVNSSNTSQVYKEGTLSYNSASKLYEGAITNVLADVPIGSYLLQTTAEDSVGNKGLSSINLNAVEYVLPSIIPIVSSVPYGQNSTVQFNISFAIRNGNAVRMKMSDLSNGVDSYTPLELNARLVYNGTTYPVRNAYTGNELVLPSNIAGASGVAVFKMDIPSNMNPGNYNANYQFEITQE